MIDLGRLDDVTADVSEVRLKLSEGGPMPDYEIRRQVLALAEAVADLADVVRDKLAELAAGRE